MRPIFHITSHTEWLTAQNQGFYTAPSLARQGFIHLSTGPQVCVVADFIFLGRTDLILLAVDSSRIQSRLIFEGETQNVFPHIYGPIEVSAVVETIPFPCELDGTFKLPERVKDLCPYYKKLKELLVQADQEATLSGYVYPSDDTRKRIPIWFQNQIVGFATPRQDPDKVWRMGAIYVTPEYRGKGLAREAIRGFMNGLSGRAFTEDGNLPTRRAFFSAGFRPHRYDRQAGGTWWSNYSYSRKAVATQDSKIYYETPIRLAPQDRVIITRSDDTPEWLGWHWCEHPQSGAAGWVSEFYFERLAGNEALILFPYDASELAVTTGQMVSVLNEDRGWAWCSAGEKSGWVPTKHLKISDSGAP